MPLIITIPATELIDEGSMRRIRIPETKIEMEHSLHAVRVWEAKWHKPFLSPLPRTNEESLDYIRCMTLTEGVHEYAYNMLTPADIQQIQHYIDDPMSATRFRGEDIEEPKKKQFQRARGSSRVNTAERIYAAMATYGIPFECEWWHLNQLLTTIHECELMNSGGRMSKRESAKWMKQANEARKAKYGTRG